MTRLRNGMRIRFLIEKYKLPLTVVEAQNGQKALEYLKEASGGYSVYGCEDAL